jgi:YqiJ-like protein
MIDALLAPEMWPFLIAAVILIVLAGIELVTMLAGFSISSIFGKEIDFGGDHVGPIEGLMVWINAGHVPLFVLILLTLGIFSVEGFLIQGVAHQVLGIRLPSWIASLIAIAGTVPSVRVTSRAIAHIIPRDETYAVSEAEFVGLIGVVSIGPLDQGLPGQVRVKDVYGNWHSVKARAGRDSAPLPSGSSVLLVDRDDRSFIAISAPADLSVPHSSNRA